MESRLSNKSLCWRARNMIPRPKHRSTTSRAPQPREQHAHQLHTKLRSHDGYRSWHSEDSDEKASPRAPPTPTACTPPPLLAMCPACYSTDARCMQQARTQDTQGGETHAHAEGGGHAGQAQPRPPLSTPTSYDTHTIAPTAATRGRHATNAGCLPQRSGRTPRRGKHTTKASTRRKAGRRGKPNVTTGDEGGPGKRLSSSSSCPSSSSAGSCGCTG